MQLLTVNDLAIAAFAFFGGIAVECLRVIELVNTPRHDRPATFSDPLFVLRFIMLPLLAGILGYVYQVSGSNLTPIVAVNIGASAPIILKSFASALSSPIASSKEAKDKIN